MPKASRERRIQVKENLLATTPWTCTNFGRQSEIDIYVKETGVWETIAQVRGIEGFDAEDIAGFIIAAVNNCGSRKGAGSDTPQAGNTEI